MDFAKNIFTCFCMMIIAGSLAFSAWTYFPINVVEAFLIAASILTVELATYLFVWKALVYRALAKKIQELTFSDADNIQRMDRFGNELQQLRRGFKAVAQVEMEPLVSELEVMGTLVRELAENSVEFDNRLVSFEGTAGAMPAGVSGRPRSSQNQEHAPENYPDNEVSDYEQMLFDAEEDLVLTSSEEDPDHLADIHDDDDDEEVAAPVVDPVIIEAVNLAVDQNQVDLYLQPVVTLPQRRPKFYEALSRIRTADGNLVRPAQYLSVAETAGAMPVLDKMLLIRAIQVLRRLRARKSDSVILCNISAASLADSVFFNDFRRLLRAKGDLANHMIFEFSQHTIQNMGPLEEESLRALKAMGFGFSMNQVRKLSIDYRRLASLGFHYIKVGYAVLVSAKSSGVNDIHIDDFAAFLARNNIQLIADQIETEAQVIEVLDLSVNLAQGYLFGGPHEVKSDGPKNTPARAEEMKAAG